MSDTGTPRDPMQSTLFDTLSGSPDDAANERHEDAAPEAASSHQWAEAQSAPTTEAANDGQVEPDVHDEVPPFDEPEAPAYSGSDGLLSRLMSLHSGRVAEYRNAAMRNAVQGAAEAQLKVRRALETLRAPEHPMAPLLGEALSLRGRLPGLAGTEKARAVARLNQVGEAMVGLQQSDPVIAAQVQSLQNNAVHAVHQTRQAREKVAAAAKRMEAADGRHVERLRVHALGLEQDLDKAALVRSLQGPSLKELAEKTREMLQSMMKSLRDLVANIERVFGRPVRQGASLA